MKEETKAKRERELKSKESARLDRRRLNAGEGEVWLSEGVDH